MLTGMKKVKSVWDEPVVQLKSDPLHVNSCGQKSAVMQACSFKEKELENGKPQE